jgi:hypothetical protein
VYDIIQLPAESVQEDELNAPPALSLQDTLPVGTVDELVVLATLTVNVICDP